jgi:hypothetical protein
MADTRMRQSEALSLARHICKNAAFATESRLL